jgi:hypothetical protein
VIKQNVLIQLKDMETVSHFEYPLLRRFWESGIHYRKSLCVQKVNFCILLNDPLKTDIKMIHGTRRTSTSHCLNKSTMPIYQMKMGIQLGRML